ncbi:hypothetical protein [Streptomyces sp. GESEQ-35]|uniref:hypothetical protein n=1 Tax=Streptomyces sp. GESEQ-35 TaxID=2812657 RepID=UPI001B31CD01|nr:hypothetical protein [Streptomyces sp. GESEQ-35]
MKTVLALARHELRLLVSLAMWVGRRRHGIGGGQAFGYAGGQGAMMFGFAFVCVIETVMMSVLLRNLPTVHGVVLILDVYTIVFVIGLHAASVVRPHVLDSGSLRVRNAAHIDLRIPVTQIASVRRELRITHTRTDGELDIPVGSQTDVTLELTEPITHFTFFGRRRDIRLVRFHADDASTLVQAIRQAVTQVQTAPSQPLPDPLG